MAAALLSPFVSNAKDTYVKGYTKKDGTYVPAHHRSSPNSSKSDNWSTKGNTNPYTGKAGAKDPYSDSSNTDSGGDESSND